MPKVVVIGIDAATPELIDRWKDELPNLSSMLDHGTHGRLESTVPPLSVPAWPCFSTGKNPAKIGIFHFIDFQRDGTVTVADSSKFADSCVWTLLSRQGLKVGAFCVPGTYPPTQVLGFMVAGFPAPFRGNYTYPIELQEELDNLLGGFELDLSFYGHGNPAEMPGGGRDYLTQVERFHEKNMKAVKHLLAKDRFDFFMAVFRELDLVQHYFWEDLDGTVKRWYVRIDQALGDLIDIIPKGTYVFANSDHGFMAAGPSFRMNEFLRRNGFLLLKDRLDRLDNSQIFPKFRRLITKVIPSRALPALRRWSPSWLTLRLSLRYEQGSKITRLTKAIDWKRTKAFAVGGGDIFRIYTLASGDDPSEQKTQIGLDITQAFANAEKDMLDRKLHFKVYDRNNIYNGKYLDRSPDFFVEVYQNDTKCLSGGEASDWKIGSETLFGNDLHADSGTHAQQGFWAVIGPGVREGAVIDAKITDIAPTILWLLDTPIPDDVDGRPITSAFSKVSQPKYERISPESEKHTQVSKEDEEKIMDRLRALGYVG